jgi:thiol-disulfide isomerase/thioredoxin
MQARFRIVIFLAAVLVFSIPGTAGAQEQDAEKKPLVMVVYADWCPLCQSLKPVLVLMNDRYRGKIHYVLLDVTSEATTARAKLLARSLGQEAFFNENYVTTSLVVIKDSTGREVFRARHDYDFHHYEAVLDQQLQIKHK